MAIIIQQTTITKWLFLATVISATVADSSTTTKPTMSSISNVATKLAKSFMAVYREGGGGVNDGDDDDVEDAAHNNNRALSDTTTIQYSTQTQVSKLEMIANFLATSETTTTNGQQQVEIRQISSSGAPNCIATYTNGHSAGSKTIPSQYWGGDPIVQHVVSSDNGLLLSTGNPVHFSEEQIVGFSQSTNWGTDGDLDLSNAVKRETYDACSIEFQFRCLASSSSSSSSVESKVSMSYQYASEEYYEPSSYSDTFAIYLNQINNDGQVQLPNNNDDTNNNNIATLMEAYGESTPVGVMTVNKYIHSLLYTDNDIGSSSSSSSSSPPFPKVQADGLTIQMIASGIVDSIIPSESNTEEGWNRIKFVVADVGDRMLDSWLLLGGGSFKCEAIIEKDADELSTTNEVSLLCC